MIRTKICDLFGVKYPILQAPMGPFVTTKLAIAVSEAGGLGTVSHAGILEPKDTATDSVSKMKQDMQVVKKGTKGNFALNIRVAKLQLLLDAYKLADMVVDQVQNDPEIKKRLKAVITSAGDPTLFTKKFKDVGLKVMHVVPTVRHAKKAEEVGCDAVIASGYEAGGHVSPTPVHTGVLVPAVVDAVKIPVIAAGGFCDGRGLASALAMGAQGIQMGTRFINTKECEFHENYKKKIMESKETDTEVILGMFGPARHLVNEYVKEQKDLVAKGIDEDKIRSWELPRWPLAEKDGDIKKGIMLCGQVAGRVKDTPTVKEVIERIMKEADETISRLQKLKGT
ncbi:MAG: nitronate monooxygenase [Candidatus Atabeyarchaeum deiterrae]|jgi:enoyl-[acyl-carrier protein] reductase II